MALRPTLTDDAHSIEEVAPPAEAAIVARSPSRIVVERLRRDKVAVVSASIVLFFILIAIFAPQVAKAFGVQEGIVESPSDVLDVTTGFGKVGPPLHGFTWEHRSGDLDGV